MADFLSGPAGRRALPLLLALLALAGCRRAEGPAPEPLRLLDAADRMTVTGAVPAVPSQGSGAPAIGAVAAPGRIARIAMEGGGDDGWDLRVALVAGSETRYRFRLDLPDHPTLRVGLGYPPPRKGAGGEAIRYRVEVAPATGAGATAGEPRVVLDERVTTDRSSGWRDREVDLDRWAGQPVLLDLVTEVAPGAADGAGAAAWAAPEVVSGRGREAGWNVLLVSLDTLRADHLSCYGHARPTSPHLDRLAAGGVRFASAFSQAPWTRPSHRSFLTSTYPASNGDLRSPMISEVLWRAGYRTTAVTGGGQVDPRFGFDHGFEAYRIYNWVGATARIPRLLEANRGRKQFLFLHTYRIHSPYTDTRFAAALPSGRIGNEFGDQDWDRLGNDISSDEERYVEALYDGNIADADRAVGEVLDGLRRDGQLEHTLVAVTSDHGESFWEHGAWRHGQNLYDEQIHVPLILHLPEALARRLGVAPGTVIRDQVRMVDLYPTLLDLAGVPLDHPVQGRSLVPLLTGGSLPPAESFAENTNIRAFERKAFRTPRFKFVESYPRAPARAQGIDQPQIELFDLRRDPKEYRNVAGRYPDLVRLLEQRMSALVAGARRLDEQVPDGLDPDLRKRLEALGYVGNR